MTNATEKGTASVSGRGRGILPHGENLRGKGSEIERGGRRGSPPTEAPRAISAAFQMKHIRVAVKRIYFCSTCSFPLSLTCCCASKAIVNLSLFLPQVLTMFKSDTNSVLCDCFYCKLVFCWLKMVTSRTSTLQFQLYRNVTR